MFNISSSDHHLRRQNSLPAIKEILVQLKTFGYFHHRRQITEQVHDSCFVESLGRAIKSSIYSPGPVGFHTAPAEIDLVSFFCIKSESKTHGTLFLDTHPILQKFTTGELEKLSQINMEPKSLLPELQREYIPLIIKNEKRYQINFRPWEIKPPKDNELVELLAKFKACIQDFACSKPFRIYLEAGESIIVDNKRLLHTRPISGEPMDDFLKKSLIKLR